MVSGTPSSVPDFPPLLPPGRHDMSLEGLRALCVTSFPLSTTRSRIMAGLEAIVAKLESEGIVGELWIDGSFLTHKMDPADADLVLRVEAEVYDNGTDEQRETIDWLGSNLSSSHRCDSYVFLVWPHAHPNYWIGEYMEAYWMRQWGFSRELTMKGIAVVLLSGGSK